MSTINTQNPSYYGAEITSEDIINDYKNEVSQEIPSINQDSNLSTDNILDASYPEYLRATTENSLDSNDYTTGAISSGIPEAIDNLWNYNNKVEKNFEPVSAIMKLYNTMTEDINITDNYNGICVDLNTVGHNLRVDKGSVLVAL